jgi:hypothetical protein
MNKEAFVNAVQLAVEDGAVTSTIQLLSHLPGRKPDERLLALSGWFNQISLSDRQQVERVIEMTAHAALFNLLCVLDGARAIEDGPVKGTLELSYRHGKTNIILNSDDGDILYDLIEAPWRRPKWVSHD